MFRNEGMTLFEIIVVLIIIGITVAVAYPNFSTSTEQSRALVARNNLLAIYSAEQNYLSNNNTTVYCSAASPALANCVTTGANCANSLDEINCNLSLNIQDDGTYTYQCPTAAATTCTATRTTTAGLGLTVTLNTPIQLTGAGPNPTCNLSTGWCP